MDNGYYRWKKHKIGSRKSRDIYLTNRIQKIHLLSKGRYGSPRITDALKDEGEFVSRKRVLRLMRENNISSKVKRKFRNTTDSKHNHLIAPNLLKQNFTAKLPNQVWVSDITYIWTLEGWLYLSVILDLCSRKVVGWNVNDRITKDLVITAFMKAYWSRKPAKGFIHHSDRGSQYASNDFQKLLKNAGAIASVYSNKLATVFLS